MMQHMSAAGRVAVLVVLLVAGALVASCGGGGGDGSTTTTATAARVATTEHAQEPDRAVAIAAPRAGARLRPRRLDGRRVVVTVRVSGTAAQQQLVRVDGHCAARSCLRMALADLTGRWTARLVLSLPDDARRARITASYALEDGHPAAERRVRVLPTPRPPSDAVDADAGDDGAAAAPDPGTATIPAPSGGDATSVAPGAATPGDGTLVVIGDSLAVGMQPTLPAAMPGWDVRIDARTGRPLAEGMSRLAATQLPRGAVLAISLFTNDDPRNTGPLRAAVQQSLGRVGPRGCVVWATIQRPPLDGVGYGAANTVLRDLARRDGRLRLVPWAEQMAAHPELLRPDGVHPTPEGYRLRSQLYAAAVASC